MRSVPARKYVKRRGGLSFRGVRRSLMNVGSKALKIGQGVLDKMDEAGEFLTKHQKKIILVGLILYCRKNPGKCTPEYIGKYIDDISTKRTMAPLRGVAEEVKDQLGVKDIKGLVKKAIANIPKRDLECAMRRIGITEQTNKIEAFFNILAFVSGEKIRGQYQGYAQLMGIPVGQVTGAIQNAVNYIYDACRELYEPIYMKALRNYEYVSSKEPYREAIFARESDPTKPLSQSEYMALQRWYNSATKDENEMVISAPPDSTNRLMKEVFAVGGLSFKDVKEFATKVVENLPSADKMLKIAGAIIGAGLTLTAIAQIPPEGYIEINFMQDYIRKNPGASLSDYAKSGKAGNLDEGHERYMGTQWQIYWTIATVVAPFGIKLSPKIGFALQKLRGGNE